MKGAKARLLRPETKNGRMEMNVSNEKELWEAFRNREQTIVAEGEVAGKISRCRIIKIASMITGVICGINGFVFVICGFGMQSTMKSVSRMSHGYGYGGGGDSSLLVMMLVLAVIFWIASAFLLVFFGKGKGKGMIAQLHNYRISKNEWGVLTLTRK